METFNTIQTSWHSPLTPLAKVTWENLDYNKMQNILFKYLMENKEPLDLFKYS